MRKKHEKMLRLEHVYKRKKNASGTTTIQVIGKRDRKNIILKVLGVSKDEKELKELKSKAKNYIRAVERERNQEQLQFSFMPEVKDGK